MKLIEMLEKGQIDLSDLSGLSGLARNKELAEKGSKACKRNIRFSMNSPTVNCYEYIDPASGERVDGNCNINGTITFTAHPKKGSPYEVGKVDLLDVKNVLIQLSGQGLLAKHLERFLRQQPNK